ncbi:MAG: hypothetical protein L0210_05585 [Rhodospirillales bacterium]|nr:hypothetical protein [Rhodospirillales bacterium]
MMTTSQDGPAPGGPEAPLLSSASVAQIAEAYRGGLGVETIARRTGLPVRDVYWVLGRENVAIRPARVARGTKPETLRLLRRIRRLRAEGHTYKEIGRLCGIAPGTVGVMLSTFREIEL